MLAAFLWLFDIEPCYAVSSLNYVCFDFSQEQLCPWGILTFQSMLIAQAGWKELQPPSCHDKTSRVGVSFGKGACVVNRLDETCMGGEKVLCVCLLWDSFNSERTVFVCTF